MKVCNVQNPTRTNTYCRNSSYRSLRNTAAGPEKLFHPRVLGRYKLGGEHLWIISSSDNCFKEGDCFFLLPPTLNLAAVEKVGIKQTRADI